MMRAVDGNGRLLDAAYSVEADGDFLALIVESRTGRPKRNPEYNPALVVLLTRLAVLDAVLVDALVDSGRTREWELPESERKIIDRPHRLADEPDMVRLRQAMGTAQAKVGQEPGASGGNSNKRIRLRLQVPGYQPGDAARLADAIAVPIATSAPAQLDAQDLLKTLVGQEIFTVTGQRNTVLSLTSDEVTVGTSRSPGGQPVPIEWVQAALERLMAAGEIEVSTAALGYRSAFIGAVLLKLPGTTLVPGSPQRVRLADPLTAYRLDAAGPLNTWWAGDQRQRFWLEITDRADTGVDLHCPQRDATGKRNVGFSAIWHVEVGDIVFHYDLKEHAITGWSRAAGQVTEAPTVWLSHRGQTRRRLQAPHAQPGWWLDLEGPFLLDRPLSLAELRGRQDDVRVVLERLRSDHSGSLYFPFSFYQGRELRPMQPYLSKLPAEFIDIFPTLVVAAELSAPPDPRLPVVVPPGLGDPYREAQADASAAGRQPFTVDPALIERGLRGHADTQNELAQALRAASIKPRSPRPDEPNFDLAWEAHGTVFVAEVKSITADNEEGQLRLGLGQVLRYRHRLERLGHDRVVAVLVSERAPTDGSWGALCQELGVVLLSREEFGYAPLLTRIHPG